MLAQIEFSYFVHVLRRVTLEGHLCTAQLERAFGVFEEAELEGARVLVDCLGMTGYDASAREWFVDWNRQHRERVDALGIVTDKAPWRMVVSAMGLASQQRLRAFEEKTSAERWLESL